jgi:hypothetical protein
VRLRRRDPGLLANLASAEAIQRYVYEDSPSTVNPEEVRPQTEFAVPAETSTSTGRG